MFPRHPRSLRTCNCPAQPHQTQSPMPNTPTSVNPAVLQLSVNLSEAQRLVAPAATELSFAFTCEHWVLSRKPLLVTQKHIVSVAVGVNVASHAPPIESLLQILPRLVASITFADLHKYTVQRPNCGHCCSRAATTSSLVTFFNWNTLMPCFASSGRGMPSNPNLRRGGCTA